MTTKCTGDQNACAGGCARICKDMQRYARAPGLSLPGSLTSFVTSILERRRPHLVVITPRRVVRSIAAFTCPDLGFCCRKEKMLQNTILPTPRWPATTPPFHLLTAPTSRRASSQPAFYHRHPEHVHIVQMLTVDRVTLHPPLSEYLFLDPDSSRLMSTVANSTSLICSVSPHDFRQ